MAGGTVLAGIGCTLVDIWKNKTNANQENTRKLRNNTGL